MVLLRKILFYIFVLIFLIGGPFLVLYSLGYLFKPGELKGLVKTGLIYISTIPRDASVYVNKRRYTKTTPTVLRDLMPGEYPLTLVCKGYKPWIRKVPVDPGKATVLERIILIPYELRKEPLVPDRFEKLISVESEDLFFLLRSRRIEDIFVFDRNQKKMWGLHSQLDFLPPSAEWETVYKVPKSHFLLVIFKMPAGKKYIWMKPREKNPVVKDLSPLFREEPEGVEWDPDEERFVFAYRKGTLTRIDTDSGALFPGFLGNLRAHDFFQKSIYGLRTDGAFFRTDLHGKTQDFLMSNHELFQSLFKPKGLMNMTVLAKDLILFVDEDGRLIANRLPYEFVPKGVEGFDFYAKDKKVLVWTSKKIGILSFSKKTREKELFEKAPEIRWIYEDGQKIGQAFWIYHGSHVLFRDGTSVYLIETEAFGNLEVHKLFTVKKGTDIYYSKENGKVYCLDGRSGQLIAAEILPKGETNFLLPLPEWDEIQRKTKIEIR